jgi:hypothetical protein
VLACACHGESGSSIHQAGGLAMTKPLAFTQAAIRRAVEGVKSAGLNVCAVTVNVDGSITIHHGEQLPLARSPGTIQPAPASKWADSP